MAPPPIDVTDIEGAPRPIAISGWFYAGTLPADLRRGPRSTAPTEPIALILHPNGDVTWEAIEGIEESQNDV